MQKASFPGAFGWPGKERRCCDLLGILCCAAPGGVSQQELAESCKVVSL